MKNEFHIPELNVVQYEIDDVIATSSDDVITPEDPFT